MAFWIIFHTKANKGHAIDELMPIKLFNSNYTRGLEFSNMSFGFPKPNGIADSHDWNVNDEIVWKGIRFSQLP